MAEEAHIRDYITVTRQHFATYHNHKENMAFVATALYLTGVSALALQKEAKWSTIFPFWITVLIATFFSALAFVFVLWQLSMRSLSADIVAACDSLRIQWLTVDPQNLNVSSTRYKNVVMPQFLRDGIAGLPYGQSAKLPIWLTLIAIIGWWVMLLARMIR